MFGFIKRSALWEWADKRRAENILRGLQKGHDMPDEAKLNRKLVRAAKMGMGETVQALAKAGASPNAQLYYTHGWTTYSYPIITWAAIKGDKAMVEALVKAGADIDRRDTHTEHTPLIEAARRGKTGMVRLLLDLGADQNKCTGIHSDENKAYITPTSPLEIAQRHGFALIEKMLQDEPDRRWQAQRDAEAARERARQAAEDEALQQKMLEAAAAQAVAGKHPSVTQTGQNIEVGKPLKIKKHSRGLFA